MTGSGTPPDSQKTRPEKAASRLVARLREEQRARKAAPDAAPVRRSLARRVLIRIANFILWFIVD